MSDKSKREKKNDSEEATIVDQFVGTKMYQDGIFDQKERDTILLLTQRNYLINIMIQEPYI